MIERFPYLAGGRPETLPGIKELAAIDRDAAVVSTADLFHHGLGYGDPPGDSLYPEEGGLALARTRIEEGIELLAQGDYWGYNQHCVRAKSDARDAGQVFRCLRGPMAGRILDLTYSDAADLYQAPPPTYLGGRCPDRVVARVTGLRWTQGRLCRSPCKRAGEEEKACRKRWCPASGAHWR